MYLFTSALCPLASIPPIDGWVRGVHATAHDTTSYATPLVLANAIKPKVRDAGR